jgi:hypothetical protein
LALFAFRLSSLLGLSGLGFGRVDFFRLYIGFFASLFGLRVCLWLYFVANFLKELLFLGRSVSQVHVRFYRRPVSFASRGSSREFLPVLSRSLRLVHRVVLL